MVSGSVPLAFQICEFGCFRQDLAMLPGLILLLQPPKNWDYRHVPLCLFLAVVSEDRNLNMSSDSCYLPKSQIVPGLFLADFFVLFFSLEFLESF